MARKIFFFSFLNVHDFLMGPVECSIDGPNGFDGLGDGHGGDLGVHSPKCAWAKNTLPPLEDHNLVNFGPNDLNFFLDCSGKTIECSHSL